jgi:hypothetical protein
VSKEKASPLHPDIKAFIEAPPLRQVEATSVRAADLKPRMYVAVTEWHNDKRNEPLEGILYSKDQGRVPIHRARRPVGTPLQVLGLALPFVTVRLDGEEHEDIRCVIDTRDCEFMKVGKDYVRSIQPRKRKKQRDDKQSHPDIRTLISGARVFRGGKWVDAPKED